jgi:hypothetical protein
MQVRAKKITFRCEPALEMFLKKFAEIHGQTPSEMIRNILTYFYTG